MSFLIKLSVKDTLSSRTGGASVRAEILSHLSEGKSVEVDFGHLPMSPSFADECLAILVHEIGVERFKKLVKIKNLNETSKRLVKHVVTKRASIPSAA